MDLVWLLVNLTKLGRLSCSSHASCVGHFLRCEFPTNFRSHYSNFFFPKLIQNLFGYVITEAIIIDSKLRSNVAKK